jgi:hypothetical protein
MGVNFDGQTPATGAILGAIKAPTLVLHGYRQVGHLPQIEIPARSAGDVAAFLEAQPLRP